MEFEDSLKSNNKNPVSEKEKVGRREKEHEGDGEKGGRRGGNRL